MQPVWSLSYFVVQLMEYHSCLIVRQIDIKVTQNMIIGWSTVVVIYLLHTFYYI